MTICQPNARHFFPAAALGIAAWCAAAVYAEAGAESLEAKAVVSDTAETMGLDYAIYVGGLESMSAALKLVRDGDSYRLELDVGTAGTVKRFMEWSMRSYSHGTIADGKVVPAEAGRESLWQGKKYSVRLRYDGGMPEVLEAVPELDEDQIKALEGADLSGTQDAAAALLQGLTAFALTGACDTETRIFDGKRIFAVRMNDGEATKLRATRYSSYAGPAVACKLQHRRLKGEAATRPAQSDFTSPEAMSASTAPRLWGGQDRSARAWVATVFPGSLPVPVRIEIESPIGLVLAHLRSAKQTKDGTTRRLGPDS